MFNIKEIVTLLVVTVVLAASANFLNPLSSLLGILLAIFILLVLNVVAKKIAAYYFESEVEIKPWTIERYGFKTHQYLKRPFPMGIVLPIIIALITVGNIIWMASIVFDVKPRLYRTAKRHGLYSFSEMTESHIGTIAAAGVVVNLVAAVLAYFLGFPGFARLNVFFSFYSLLPISDLDGNKIFFGNIVLWSFLAALALIGLGYAFFLT